MTKDRHAEATRQYNFRIPRTLADDFKRTCGTHGLTTSEVLRALVQGYVEVGVEAKAAAH